MTISGANGTGGDHNVRAAELYSLGTAEAAVAMASVHLDEQQATARQAQRAAQHAQRAAAEQRIEEMRDAATRRLIGGLVSGAAQVAAGTALMNGSIGNPSPADMQHAKGSAELYGAVGKLVGAGCDFAAAQNDADAAAAQEAASRHQQNAQELGEDVDRAGRLSDKVSNHLDQVAQARREAERLASSRG